MPENKQDTFDQIFKQNKNRIHYQMHKLGLQDPHNEFYTEGIYAMWNAYKKYQPNKGPMGTYFNYQIRYRLIYMLRKKTNELIKIDEATQKGQADIDDGNRYGTLRRPMVNNTGINTRDNTFWTYIRSRLTPNQWKWVRYYIIAGMSQHDIATQENVTTEAVKSWGKEARRKLRQEQTKLNDMR